MSARRPGSTATTTEQYVRSHPKGVGRGFWHVARNAVLWSNLRPELTARGRVLDIGCGPGVVVAFLRDRGVDCIGVDLGTPEPETEEIAPHLFLGKRSQDLPAAVREEVEALLLMDVLEHLPDPLSLLEDCYRDYPNAHTVYVTVPARHEVWSAWDEFHGHYRRYTRETLEALVADSTYTLERSAYFFHSLYWAMRVIHAVARQRSTKVSSPRFLVLQRLLGGLFHLEHRVAPSGLRGSSLYAVLRRS